MSKKKRWFFFTKWTIAVGVVVSISAFALINVSSITTSFSENSIGIYVEKEWEPAYEKAVEKYNETKRTYNIEIKELAATDAYSLVTTLGATDQKVADLIYIPLDRIPSFVQDYQALMGFDTPEALLEGIDPQVYGDDIEGFATKGAAKVTSYETGETINSYFAIPHSTESLIMFYKGKKPDSTSTLDTIADSVISNGWANSMFGYDFNNLWYSLGVVAGFVEQLTQGAGFNGQNVGRLFVTNNDTGYQSNMTKINNVTYFWDARSFFNWRLSRWYIKFDCKRIYCFKKCSWLNFKIV